MQPAVKNNPSLIWIKIFFALVLSLLALRFIFKNALPYFGFQQAYFDDYWSVRWWPIGHISGGLIALLIGPLQFWPSFRKNYKYTHRFLGRIYLSAIFIASLCALYITVKNDYAAKWSWSVSLQGLVLAWLTTSFMAYRSARK